MNRTFYKILAFLTMGKDENGLRTTVDEIEWAESEGSTDYCVLLVESYVKEDGEKVFSASDVPYAWFKDQREPVIGMRFFKDEYPEKTEPVLELIEEGA